jgi:flagellar hook-associated protein 2
LQITSQQYGSGSQVAFAGGGTLAALGLTGAETGTGSDVVGQSVVNGQIEAATGSGQSLSGNSGNANTSGPPLHPLSLSRYQTLDSVPDSDSQVGWNRY